MLFYYRLGSNIQVYTSNSTSVWNLVSFSNDFDLLIKIVDGAIGITQKVITSKSCNLILVLVGELDRKFTPVFFTIYYFSNQYVSNYVDL